MNVWISSVFQELFIHGIFPLPVKMLGHHAPMVGDNEY